DDEEADGENGADDGKHESLSIAPEPAAGDLPRATWPLTSARQARGQGHHRPQALADAPGGAARRFGSVAADTQTAGSSAVQEPALDVAPAGGRADDEVRATCRADQQVFVDELHVQMPSGDFSDRCRARGSQAIGGLL